jgi:WD40 repeat protein
VRDSQEKELSASHFVREFRGHTSGITNISYSHKGDRLVTSSSKDGTARVWSWNRNYRAVKHVVLAAATAGEKVAVAATTAGQARGRAGGRARGGAAKNSISVDMVVWTATDVFIVTSQV